jgi:uncharacterized lipoprotein YehR (DUF1307 family)
LVDKEHKVLKVLRELKVQYKEIQEDKEPKVLKVLRELKEPLKGLKVLKEQ